MATQLETATDIPLHSHAGVDFCCRTLRRYGFAEDPTPRILVVGCGAGHEAAYLQREFAAQVTAIDVELCHDRRFESWPNLEIQQASVEQLPFEDDAFDFVFYHHVIEHVQDPAASLEQIARVLAPQGWLFIGTPNRQRLVSAVGGHKQTDWDSTWKNKLRENVQDWNARLRGRFANKYGAHAGFSRPELDGMLAKHFVERRWLTREYLQFKYARLRPLVDVATLPAWGWFVAPGIYVMSR